MGPSIADAVAREISRFAEDNVAAARTIFDRIRN
jgi:hypothetical protein